MLPKNVRQFFWSYDIEQIDEEKDKKRIIFNILNFGDFQAWRWLLARYDREELRRAVRDSIGSEWNNKSLNYWSIILEVSPLKKARFS